MHRTAEATHVLGNLLPAAKSCWLGSPLSEREVIAAAAHSLTCFGGKTLDKIRISIRYVGLKRSSEGQSIVFSVLR